MRMRKKKHGAERLAANARYLLERPEAPLADPSALFGREAPTYLEIGCGKGGFASGMAEKYLRYLCFQSKQTVHGIEERHNLQHPEPHTQFYSRAC